MDKTIKINLGGILFQIDEEAYKMLRDYLQAIDRKFRNVQGGSETIEDIEFRIAEIFQSQKGTAGVISRENVEAVISVIGSPGDFDTEGEAAASSSYDSGPKKLFRNPDDSIIGGVCGGIGAYADTDPVWFRLLFIVSALIFGIGFLVYLALWIALPSANTPSMKREMYGSSRSSFRSQDGELAPRYQTTSRIGNAFNEVFKAVGKVLFIIVRVLLIILGTSLVLTGFMAILSFIMIFVFEYPGAFSTNIAGADISYLPDFLDYVVSAAAAPWIRGLITLIVIIPFLAMVYGGIRLIFWFRARDGYIWLIALLVWVLSMAALSIIMFNEGVGFAESEKVTGTEYFVGTPDTLYITAGKKISELNAGNEISLPDDDYRVLIDDDKKEIYIRSQLDIRKDEENEANIQITRRSSGRNRLDAIENAERIQYHYMMDGKRLILDEYFSIPTDSKWSFDELHVLVCVPEGTVIYMDRTTESLVYPWKSHDYVSDSRNRLWLMTEDGLEYIKPATSNQ